jgi:hypothetical protein
LVELRDSSQAIRVIAVVVTVTTAVISGGVSMAAAHADKRPTSPVVAVTPSPDSPQATPGAGRPETSPGARTPQATPGAP